MKCNACGREIPDQAQFCNYCGSKVIAKESPVSQPVQKSEAYAAPANHKTSGGFVVLIILLIIVMISGGFFLLRYVGTIDIYQKTESSIPFTSKSSQTANPSLTASCKYGALYKDGYHFGFYIFFRIGIGGCLFFLCDQHRMGVTFGICHQIGGCRTASVFFRKGKTAGTHSI